MLRQRGITKRENADKKGDEVRGGVEGEKREKKEYIYI